MLKFAYLVFIQNFSCVLKKPMNTEANRCVKTPWTFSGTLKKFGLACALNSNDC